MLGLVCSVNDAVSDLPSSISVIQKATFRVLETVQSACSRPWRRTAREASKNKTEQKAANGRLLPATSSANDTKKANITAGTEVLSIIAPARKRLISMATSFA